MNQPIAGVALVMAVALSVAGCGGNKPYPVQGRIVFSDGQPATELAGFIVALDSSESATGATGVVQPDATFTMGTHETDDGALPGKYRVSLTPPEPPLDQPAPKPVIDPKYGNSNSSGLDVEIKPEQNEVILTVERKP